MCLNTAFAVFVQQYFNVSYTRDIVKYLLQFQNKERANTDLIFQRSNTESTWWDTYFWSRTAMLNYIFTFKIKFRYEVCIGVDLKFPIRKCWNCYFWLIFHGFLFCSWLTSRYVMFLSWDIYKSHVDARYAIPFEGSCFSLSFMKKTNDLFYLLPCFLKHSVLPLR